MFLFCVEHILAAFRCELMTGLHPRWSIAVAGGIVLRSVDRKLFIIILIGKHIDSGSNAVVSKCLRDGRLQIGLDACRNHCVTEYWSVSQIGRLKINSELFCLARMCS